MRPNRARATHSIGSGFRPFFLAALVSKAGTHVGRLAVSATAVTVLAATPAQVGLLGIAGTAAFLVLGLPAGAWLDRVRRRPVLIAADVARGLLLLSVPLAALVGVLTFAQLVTVVLFVGVGTVFFDVAAQSFVPLLAPPTRLVAANARLSSVDSAGQIAGPAVAGVLVALVGGPAVMLLDALSYLASAWLLLRVRASETPPPRANRPGLLRQILEGAGFVRRQPVLRVVLLSGIMSNLGVSMVFVLAPVLVLRDGAASGYLLGSFLAAGGVGVLVGNTLAPVLSRRLGEGRSLWIVGMSVAPAAVALPLLAHRATLPIATVAWGVLCAKVGYDNVLLVAFRQRVAPAAILGRVVATMRVALTAGITIGSALAGVGAQSVGETPTLVVAACLLAGAWLPIVASPLRRVTALDDVVATA